MAGRTPEVASHYRSGGVSLLRAAVVPLSRVPDRWPDPADAATCRAWLELVWNWPQVAEVIGLASPVLAVRVEQVLAGQPVADRKVCSATAAVVRYLLRSVGRPTPFGLFAGVASASWGAAAWLRFGEEHRALVSPDTRWLADVIEGFEACPDLLDRLDVVFSNLAVRRGVRLEAPHGQNRVTVRQTGPVRAVQDAAATPTSFSALTGFLCHSFPGVDPAKVRALLEELVRQGFLITSLRAPMTDIDPLGYLIARLRDVGADMLPAVAPRLAALQGVYAGVRRHNQLTMPAEQGSARALLGTTMRGISGAGRTPLSVDLRLDCDLQLPTGIAEEMEHAANVLARLSPRPIGSAVWADYHRLFTERYGTGVLVSLLEVVNPDGGLGYPAGYPGSVLPVPVEAPTDRDRRLAALAWQALADGSPEIPLTEETISALTDGDHFDPRYVQAHVELAARIHAESLHALDGGEYTLTVRPARAVGTLTARFAQVALGSGLEQLYRRLPTVYAGALPVQLSFPPVYPSGEHVGRIPAYLPDVLALGEHRGVDEEPNIVGLGDLAVTATRHGLHLVSLNSRRVVEPQVFHALALDKQVPSLARFLAALPRAYAADYLAFDWGVCARDLPYLPGVRYRRTILSPARWRLGGDVLPGVRAGDREWRQVLSAWRQRTRCPHRVELRDGDLTLRLDLDEPAHAASLRNHLAHRETAILTEACDPVAFGWFGGHAHEIVVPLVRGGAPAPNLLAGRLPLVTNAAPGHLPGSPHASWLCAKIHTHPERLSEIIAGHLPRLLAELDGEPPVWFVRYRDPRETDHLRLRVRVETSAAFAAHAAAVASWTEELRVDGLAGRLLFDTYYPEVGRYGDGEAMDAAEAVFAADSLAAVAELTCPPADVPSRAMTALNMLDIAEAFLGSMAQATGWLADRPVRRAPATDRVAADHAVRLARRGVPRELPDWPTHLRDAWRVRAHALASYRKALPPDVDIDSVLEALIHLHHNRVRGIDREGERACRRLARQAALAWQAAHSRRRP
jgi:thiopeptide-type bacteriocin biosynthesis protein